MEGTQDFSLSCPIPISDYPRVLLAHGGGGKLMHQLIEQMFVPTFRNPLLDVRHDGAVVALNGAKLAFTTDSYVVQPLCFPGGDIGTLAVNGTVNDLAMCGARPLYLSAGFILEEGLSMETLWQIVRSMRQAADTAHVQLVTGDTKVVDRGPTWPRTRRCRKPSRPCGRTWASTSRSRDSVLERPSAHKESC